MTSIVVVSAGLSIPSSTRLLADRLGAAVHTELHDRDLDAATVEVVELRPLAHDLADRMLTGFATPALAEALELVERADALVVVTPVFTASYSGLFKSFFDVVDRHALTGVPVLLAATAGTARHSLVIDQAMRPLFASLRALTVPTGVFAATADFGADADLSGRIGHAAAELVDLLDRRLPAERPRTLEDELADPTAFEELLRRASA